MQETIIVLFIFILILISGLVFFYRYSIGAIDDARLEYDQNRVSTLLSTLPNHPSLSLNELGDAKPSLDAVKLINSNLEGLGDLHVVIKQVYPKAMEEECNLETYPDCDAYIIYSDKGTGKSSQIFSTPVSLYHSLAKNYTAAVLEITWYH